MSTAHSLEREREMVCSATLFDPDERLETLDTQCNFRSLYIEN